MTTKYRFKDRTDWPVISKEMYAEMMTQVATGLLASGHYTSPVAESSEDSGLVIQKDAFGYWQSIVTVAAEEVVQGILVNCDLNPPDFEGPYEIDPSAKV